MHRLPEGSPKFLSVTTVNLAQIDIIGCQTESPTKDCVMYDSYAAKQVRVAVAVSSGLSSNTYQRIWIHKLRQFKPHGEGSTLVEERIEGTCPGWMKWVCEREARAAHRYVARTQLQYCRKIIDRPPFT